MTVAELIAVLERLTPGKVSLDDHVVFNDSRLGDVSDFGMWIHDGHLILSGTNEVEGERVFPILWDLL